MNLATLSVGAARRTVHYYRKGQGQPLLYLHHMLGIVGFEAALAKLAESFDVIAPYAPGWGPAKDDLTDIDPGPLDLTLHNVDLLNALGVKSAHVVGISIGAWMAMEHWWIARSNARRPHLRLRRLICRFHRCPAKACPQSRELIPGFGSTPSIILRFRCGTRKKA